MAENTVLTSRVRLARNIEGLPFPNAMTAAELRTLIERVDAAVKGEFLRLDMASLPAGERQLLVERHLISPDLARSAGATFINQEETVSILVGEEDHIRLQCLLPGLQLHEADTLAQAVERLLGKALPFAFHEEFGFLTACPTNLGTGMRASVMVHLPAIALAGQAQALLAAITKLGYAVRGIYGEGSGAAGHIFQISNQATLGMLEEDLIGNLQATVRQILDREEEIRRSLYEGNRIAIEDIVFRSYGLLRYARKVTTEEAMEHIGNLKLGVGLALLPEALDSSLNRLLTETQPANLTKRAGRDLGPAERDEARAALLREALKET